MAVVKTVENGVQAKSVIETFLTEGYEQNHIHIFAHNEKRANDIAEFLDVDAKTFAEGHQETGFMATLKNLFQGSPEDLSTQLTNLGVPEFEHDAAKRALDNGQLVIVAHHPERI